MGNAGIGTPYWYEWEIGIIECLHMMTDASIESVTLQSSKFQSLDDVVINYADGSIANIQCCSPRKIRKTQKCGITRN